ncbi:hypothetical protein ABPG75_001532 [Micractinium tetrahymenae]
MVWRQHELILPPYKRGCHLITDMIAREVASSLQEVKVGLAHVFIQHTSASLTINENADPDVRVDMETFFNKVVPEGRGAPWVHTDEGDDDMPAHCKASIMGSRCSMLSPMAAIAQLRLQGAGCRAAVPVVAAGSVRGACFRVARPGLLRHLVHVRRVGGGSLLPLSPCSISLLRSQLPPRANLLPCLQRHHPHHQWQTQHGHLAGRVAVRAPRPRRPAQAGRNNPRRVTSSL